jgi:hypothetical protein
MINSVNVLSDKQIISSGAFTALLLAAIGSKMLTIPFAAPALKNYLIRAKTLRQIDEKQMILLHRLA